MFRVMERGYQTDNEWEKVADFDTKFEAREFAQNLMYDNIADKEIGAYDPEYETKVEEV